MKLSTSSSLALILPFVTAQCSTNLTAAETNLTVETRTGSYTGVIEDAYPNTRIYKSIAFAEPPVTSKRWLPPQPLQGSSKHYYAYNYPPSCPQYVSKTPTIWNQYLKEVVDIYNGNQGWASGLSGEATSEDCLYLAVWTPANATPDSNLPVMFFMTGGGLQTGGVNIQGQYPTEWVQRTQDHIVVTINYRVNIFGFPNAAGLDSQNLGILDQRAALEWVRDNIANFGGDPNHIVQWGQSAGSWSVDYHSYAYYRDPIASGYHAESGTALRPYNFTDFDHTNFTFVAQQFGCDFPNNAQAELDCMRLVPFAQIENFIGQYGDNMTMPSLNFGVVPDDKTIFSNYTARSEAGKVAKVPIILSNCANEEGSLVPWPVNNLTAGPWPPSMLSMVLSQWVCPAANATVLRNNLDIPVYRYQHAGTYPNTNPYSWLGAYHDSDLFLIMGTYGLLNNYANTTAFQVQVSHSLQDHLLAFARDPWNGAKGLGWQPTNTSAPGGGTVLRFGADGVVVQSVNRTEIDGPCRGIGTYDIYP